MSYSENANTFKECIEAARKLPNGKYKACTERTNELVGPMLLTRDTSWRTYKNAEDAMRKAKRMAESLDRMTRGQENGIIYFIEPVNE